MAYTSQGALAPNFFLFPGCCILAISHSDHVEFFHVSVLWPAEGAALIIRSVPLSLACSSCRTTYQPEDMFDPCPVCGDVNPEVLTGKELRVVAIET